LAVSVVEDEFGDMPDVPAADVESVVVAAVGGNTGSVEPEGGYEVVMGDPSLSFDSEHHSTRAGFVGVGAAASCVMSAGRAGQEIEIVSVSRFQIGREYSGER
jgi:hypothetical protein